MKGIEGVWWPGAGRETVILLEALALKQPALWICHTHELLEQTGSGPGRPWAWGPGTWARSQWRGAAGLTLA